MPTSIWTLGFNGRTVRAFLPMVERMNATVVDIRYWPKNRYAEWNDTWLSTYLGYIAHGGRYTWLREWSPPTAGIKDHLAVRDFAGGLERFENLPNRPVILLCSCRGETQCHRGLVAKLLSAEGYTVRELDWQRIQTKTNDLVLS